VSTVTALVFMNFLAISDCKTHFNSELLQNKLR